MKFKIYSLLLFFIAFTLFVGCGEKDDDKIDDTTDNTGSALPASMSVDINDALSKTTGKRSGITGSIRGEDIYENMRVFIFVGEAAAQIVDGIITAISSNNINKAMKFSFVGDDGRTKIAEVQENVSFDGETWGFFLEILDQDSSKALQVFWNESPVKGITILDFDKLNNNDTDNPDALAKIEYSEAETGYDKRMIVSITGLTPDPTDKGSMDNLKMWVGKRGDILDVYGNSNHPSIQLIDTTFTGGRNWAFVAHGDQVNDVGVAEVGLPPSKTETNASILTDYSIDKVLTEELKALHAANPDTATVDSIIAEVVKYAKPPGYFVGNQGFVSNADSIPNNAAFTSTFLDLSALTPHIPVDVRDLTISFK